MGDIRLSARGYQFTLEATTALYLTHELRALGIPVLAEHIKERVGASNTDRVIIGVDVTDAVWLLVRSST